MGRKGPIGLRRDDSTQAILVTDDSALAAYKARKRERKAADDLAERIKNIEQFLEKFGYK